MSIEGFEEETAPLNEQEQILVGGFCSSLSKRIGKDHAITSHAIILAYMPRIKLTGARVRKIINYIRMKGFVLGLIATSKGYYISRDRKEIEKYNESLQGRVDAILALIRQNENYLRTLPK